MGVQVGGYVGGASVGLAGVAGTGCPIPAMSTTNGLMGLYVKKMTP
jgi:hypothetical protein